MDYKFRENRKFALLAVHEAVTDLPDAPFQLSDGTWVMASMPPTDYPNTWKEWLGSIRAERLGSANLVLLAEEPSDYPWVLDAVNRRLSDDLGLLFYVLHLNVGIVINGDDRTDRLCGTCMNGTLEIRQVDQMPRFRGTFGQRAAPITKDWLDDSLVLREGVAELKADQTQFKRLTYGLSVLFKGLREEMGCDRLHQFVRSLEGLVLPEKGKTKRQFVHRCQTFAGSGDVTRDILSEAYDLRSATEHLNPPERVLRRSNRLGGVEVACLQRTQQMERLACHAYLRLLRNPDLRRKYFRTDDELARFWKLPDDQRGGLWGPTIDLGEAA